MIKLLQALPIAMLANILGGMVLGKIRFEFDKQKLIEGLLKGIGVYAMIGSLVVVAFLMPELLVNFNGTEITITEATNALLYASIAWYAVQALQKLAKILRSKQEPEINVIDEGVEQSTFEVIEGEG